MPEKFGEAETVDDLIELLECYLYDFLPSAWVDDMSAEQFDAIGEKWKRQSKPVVERFLRRRLEEAERG